MEEKEEEVSVLIILGIANGQIRDERGLLKSSPVKEDVMLIEVRIEFRQPGANQ